MDEGVGPHNREFQRFAGDMGCDWADDTGLPGVRSGYRKWTVFFENGGLYVDNAWTGEILKGLPSDPRELEHNKIQYLKLALADREARYANAKKFYSMIANNYQTHGTTPPLNEKQIADLEQCAKDVRKFRKKLKAATEIILSKEELANREAVAEMHNAREARQRELANAVFHSSVSDDE